MLGMTGRVALTIWFGRCTLIGGGMDCYLVYVPARLSYAKTAISYQIANTNQLLCACMLILLLDSHRLSDS
jgi:hypothetical protein